MKVNRFLTLTAAALVPALTWAQREAVRDSVPSTKEVKNRNVMLNASSDNQPRTISIGLPATSTGVTIFENGLPVSYSGWPCMAFKSWAGTASYERTSLMSLSESTLRNGEVGYIVDSYTREGGDRFKGVLDYTANHFGLQRFDLNLSGPIAKGWSYTLGSYQNFDPGTTKPGYATVQSRMQIYKAGLTKVWNDNRGRFSIFYRASNTRDLTDNNGPFYYEGDGSVKLLDGFDLGRDAYLPTDDRLTLMDVMTGRMKTVRFSKANHDWSHDVNAYLNYDFRNGMNLIVRSRYKDANTRMLTPNIAGLDRVTSADGYTDESGKAYEGNVQQRFLKSDNGFERSWLTNAELTGKSKDHAHSWCVGLNEYYNRAGIRSSTAMMAHTGELPLPEQAVRQQDQFALLQRALGDVRRSGLHAEQESGLLGQRGQLPQPEGGERLHQRGRPRGGRFGLPPLHDGGQLYPPVHRGVRGAH